MEVTMREQLLFSRMEKRRRSIFIPIVIAVSLIVIGLTMCTILIKYTPPSHDSTAKTGIPNVDENYMYGSVNTEFGYVIQMAANLYQQKNGDVNIYFTNPISNSVLLRCEIIDKDSGKTLYNTGYINPGEYIESVNNNSVDNEKYDVITKVYAYTKDSFTSEGTTELSMKLQPW
ncbi:MAG: hypothetical protein K5644_07775 [Lachnospiraceae bacterium]|nr:hypothetical protein [Lachnospiraceae bacterium]